MNKTYAAGLLALLSGCTAVDTHPIATAAATVPKTAWQAGAAGTMPAPQAPFDSTLITPVESAGAAAAD